MGLGPVRIAPPSGSSSTAKLKLKYDAVETLDLSPARVDVIPHVAIGLASAATPQSSTAEDPKCVLFFGRIWAYKGLADIDSRRPRSSQPRFLASGSSSRGRARTSPPSCCGARHHAI